MKILIATDGSEFSEEAIKKINGFVSVDDETSIRIISVVEPFAPVASDAFGVAVDYYRVAEKTAVDGAENAVKEAKARLQSAVGKGELDITTEVIQGKYPKNAIVEDAEDWGADLVVVGSHGYGFWDRMLIGSVSSAVVHYAPCSVLIVRSEKG